MSFLKTFSKRADEPFRPDLIEEEEPVEVEAAAPVEAAPADKAADVTVTPVAPVTTPSAPVQVDKIEVPEGAFSTVDLAENLEALDQRKIAFDVAQQGSLEPIKALRELVIERQKGSDIPVSFADMVSLGDGDSGLIKEYLWGVGSDRTYTTAAGEVKPVTNIFTESVLKLPEDKMQQLKEEGRQLKKVRTYEDIVVDAFTSALKSQYVKSAGGDKKAGTEKYRTDLQALADSQILVESKDGSTPPLRAVETALSQEYARRMAASDAGPDVNPLLAVASAAGEKSFDSLEDSKVSRVTTLITPGGNIFGDDPEEILAAVPRNVLADAIERKIIKDAKPEFSDIKGLFSIEPQKKETDQEKFVRNLKESVPDVPVVVTSETRTPADQARAMDSLRQRYGDDYVRNLYKRKDLVEEILALEVGDFDQASQVIQAQVDSGNFISKHLIEDALDIRTRDLTPEQIDQIASAASNLGATVIIESDHIHIQSLSQDDLPKEPTRFDSGVDLGPSLEAQREQEVREAELGLTATGVGRYAAETAPLISGIDSDEEFERLTGVRATMVASETIETETVAEKYFTPKKGTQRYEVSTRTWRLIQKHSPEEARRLVDFSQEAVGQGFENVRREVEAQYESRIKDGEFADLTNEELKRRMSLEALDIITSMQVAGVWASPVYVSFDQLLGKEPAETLSGAMAPRIEILGRSGDEIIYRAESGSMTLMSALDSQPIIGQAYNVGFLENYVAPKIGVLAKELGNLYNDSSWQNLAALGINTAKAGLVENTASTVSGFISEEFSRMHDAGIRGVAGRANFAEFVPDVSVSLTDYFLEDSDIDIKTRDEIRTYVRLAAIAPGLFISVVHWDLMGGLASASRGAKAATRTLLALPEMKKALSAEVMGGLTIQKVMKGEGFDGRQRLFAAGDSRLELTAESSLDLEDLRKAGTDPEGASADDISKILGRQAAREDAMTELDTADANRREASPILMDILDKATSDSVNLGKASGDIFSASLTDEKRAQRVAAIVENLIDPKRSIDEFPEPQQAKIAALREILSGENSAAKLSTLTLEPGAARGVSKDDTVAREVFSTGERARALRLAIELYDDIGDSFKVRRTVFDQNIAEPVATLNRVDIDTLDIELPEGVENLTRLNSLDVFGAVSEEALRASPEFKRLGDAEKTKVLESRAALEALTEKIKKAATTDRYEDSLLNSDVADALFREVSNSGLIDGAAYSPLIYRNRGRKGQRFNHAVSGLIDQASAVSGSSTLQQDLFIGLGGILSYNQHRGNATKHVARELVDPVALGVAADATEATRRAAVDAYLMKTSRSSRGERLGAAIRSGTKEGVLSGIAMTPIIGAPALLLGGVSAPEVSRLMSGSKAVYRAKMDQMMADGSDPQSVASAVQREVLRRLNSRRQAITSGIESDAVAPVSVQEIDAAIERVAKDDWRVSLVTWIHDSVDKKNAGMALPEPFTDLPIAIDLSVFSGGTHKYKVTAATKNFVKNSGFLKAYGFAGETDSRQLRFGQARRARKKKLSKAEQNAAMTVLDQMVRFMAKVDKNDSTEAINAKMANWYEAHIKGVRRTVSQSAYARALRNLSANYYEVLATRVDEILGQPVAEFIAEKLADPANIKVPNPYDASVDAVNDFSPGSVAARFDDAGERIDDVVYEIYGISDDGTVSLRPFGDTAKDNIVEGVGLDNIRVLTGDVRRQLDEAILDAQLVAIESLLPVMSDLEAQALFGAGVDAIQQQIELRRAGIDPTMETARFLDQDQVFASQAAAARALAARVTLRDVADASTAMDGYARRLGLAAAADAYGGSGAPRYLDGVIDYLRERRAILKNGEVSTRDFVKSWLITAMSQRAQEKSVEATKAAFARQGIDLNDLKGGVDFDDAFTTGGKVRPEEAAAAWLLSPTGQRFLDDYENGIFNQQAYNTLVEIRNSPFGAAQGMKQMAGKSTSAGKSIADIDGVNEVLAQVNAAKGDYAKLNQVLTDLKFIQDGKSGFIKHFLGLGDTPTVDERAVVFWLDGRLSDDMLKDFRFSVRDQSEPGLFSDVAAARKKILASASDVLRDRILSRMNDLQATGVGADLEPEVAAHILHHWIWDTVGDTPVTHEGLYTALRLAQMPDGAQSAAATEVLPALAPEFYSRLRQAVAQEQQKTFTPDQLRARLRKVGGVKQDEIDQVRLEEFLSDKTKVTKEELLEWLDDNAVRIEFRDTGNIAAAELSSPAAAAFVSKFVPEDRNLADSLQRALMYTRKLADGTERGSIARIEQFLLSRLPKELDDGSALSTNPAYQQTVLSAVRLPNGRLPVGFTFDPRVRGGFGANSRYFPQQVVAQVLATREDITIGELLTELNKIKADLVPVEGRVRLANSRHSSSGFQDYKEYTVAGGRNYRELLAKAVPKPSIVQLNSTKLLSDDPEVLEVYRLIKSSPTKLRLGLEDFKQNRINRIEHVVFDKQGNRKVLATEFSYERGPGNPLLHRVRDADGNIIYSRIEPEASRGLIDEVDVEVDRKLGEIYERAGVEDLDMGKFFGHNFADADIIAHMRTTDRVSPEGERFLFIEEIQSDWHQAARKPDFTGERGPMSKTWVDLMIKKALRIAAEGGYDGIAISRGDVVQRIVGGELAGQKKFYDEIVPKRFNKIVKKDGGRLIVRKDLFNNNREANRLFEVEEIHNTPLFYFEMPKATKQRVLREGQMLFQRDEAPKAATAAARAATDDKYVLKAREMFDNRQGPNAAAAVQKALEENVGANAAKAFIDEYNSLRDASVRARMAQQAAAAVRVAETVGEAAPAAAPTARAAATAAARAADDTLDTAAAKKASSMIGEQLTLKFDKSPDSTAKKAADTVVTPTADDDLEALAARGRVRAERLAVDIPEEDYATVAKKYQDLSEEKLLKMLDDRGISPSKVDFMSDRDRYIDALVISDFTPLEEFPEVRDFFDEQRKAFIRKGTTPPGVSYDEMSRDELRELISSRNEGRKKADRIKITGSLEALQKRIEADDAAQAIARGDVAPPDSFVPAKLPDKLTFGRKDAARSKPIEVTARREIRISDPLMGEDIVLFEPVAVELIRITKDQPKEVPRKFSQLQKNYLSWRMKSKGESKEKAQEVLDRILSNKSPQKALVQDMDTERSASDVEEYIRLLKTSDDKPVFVYSHSLDNTKRFDSPDKALEDVNARLSIPENRAAQSIDQIIPYLDEADLGVIKRTLDAAGDTEGRLNINTMRKVAEGVSEDRLQDLYGMMSRVGLVKKTATARGVKELSPKAAEDLSKRLDEFFDPRVQAERILSATNIFNRIDELTLDALTAPDQAMDEDIAAFLQDLKKSSPEAYEELLEQKRSALTSELRDIRDTIVRHERILRRLKAKTPKTSRSRALNEAAQLETERRIESLRVDFESLSEVLADPSDIPEIASDVAIARSRAARDASGVADIPPAKPSVAGSVPPDAGMPKGMVYFFNDTAAILYAFRQADISTGLHEMAHVLRRQLDNDQLRSVTRWVNGQLQKDRLPPIRLTERNGRLDFDFPNNPESVVAAEELFARAFERYLREGETPNTLLQSAFATMRDVLKRIYSAITGKEIDVYISDEMYNLFDEIFGAQRQISLSDLSDGPQMYLDMQNDLARGGQRRLTARIAEQEQVEDTFVESYRQLSASLADYRARLFKIGKEVTAGPGRLKVDQGMQLGPVSRRLMTLEQIGEARKRGRVGRAYQAADALAVAGATVAEGIVYVTLLGGDANKIVRLAPPAIRAALTGHAREYEEFSSELSMRLIDISRMSPSQRTKGIRDLIKYVRGQEVQMKTGAQRGQRARANFVNAEDHFEKMITAFYTKISDDSMELVADDVSRVLAGLGQKYGAMNGFWKGYAVKPVAGAVGKVDDVLSGGVFLSDDLDQLLKSVSGKNIKQQLTEMRTEMFDNLYAAVAGVDNYVSGNPEATRLAAEMAFLSGVTPVTINGKKFTIADLDTERSFFDYLFFGGTVRNSEGAEMVLKGLANITAQTPDRTVGAFAIAAQTGYLSGIYSDLRKVGLGLTASDARVFAQYLSGEGALLSTEDLAKAKELFRRFGRTKFEISPEALGNFYIPQQTRKLLMEQQKQALRQMGLSKKTAGFSWNPLSWMLSFYQSMIIFGGVFQRQAFKFTSTIDLGLQVGMTVGGREGAAAAARASALTLLSAIGGERIAEVSELTVRAAYAIAGKTMPPEMFKTKLRELAIKGGDKAVNTVTELMGMSKFRVEVNPIIENRDKLYAIGGRVYNARDLRRTFTQAGMYSNAFKEMRQNWWRDLPQKEAEKEPLSDANRKFFDSVKESTGEFFDDPGRISWAAARRSASTVFEHGVESADAWSDLERTGTAVTLMEFGYSPRDAAKIVVESVYDYRGSMTNLDRHWIRRLLMPFWAFRKNANTQAINMLATPQGVMRVTALRRAMEFGPEALTYVMYESLLQPYDVDVSLMNPRVRDVYYETRTIIEMGYGDEPSEEVLAEYRAQLPDEAVNISDEDLLDYSFDGWTIRSGFKGYSNVPERFRVSFRALLSGNTSSMVRQRGGVYRLSDAIAQQSVSDFYVQEGAEMAARAERGETGLPAWAAKRPAIQVPLPTLNESVREVIKFLKNTGMTPNDVPDPGDSLYFVLPDNFVMSAVDHAGAMLATTAVIGQMAKKGLDEDVDITKADTTRLLNAVQPIVDVRQSGSAQLELIEKLVSQAKAVGGGVSPRQRLHPITARLLEGSLGIPLPYEGGKPKNSPGSAFFFEVSGSETVETLAKVAGGTLGDIDTRGDVPGRFSRMYSRPVEVVARDSEGRTREDPDFDITTAKREVSVVQPFFSGTAFDYTVPNSGKEGEERLAYTPYLYGTSAITFPLTFLGQFNKWLLTNVGDGPIETSMLQNGDVQNEILNLAAEFYKLVGGRVTEADYGKIASMERIRE